MFKKLKLLEKGTIKTGLSSVCLVNEPNKALLWFRTKFQQSNYSTCSVRLFGIDTEVICLCHHYEVLNLGTFLLLSSCLYLPQSHRHTMKRPMPWAWSDGEDDSSSDDSSTLDTDKEANDGSNKINNAKISGTPSQPSKGKASRGKMVYIVRSLVRLD